MADTWCGHGFFVHDRNCKDCEIADLRAQLEQAQAGAPGTPLGRWNAISEWALSQPWCNPFSSAGWETQMKATIARQRAWIESAGHRPGCASLICATCGEHVGADNAFGRIWHIEDHKHPFQSKGCDCGFAELVGG